MRFDSWSLGRLVAVLVTLGSVAVVLIPFASGRRPSAMATVTAILVATVALQVYRVLSARHREIESEREIQERIRR